MAKGLTDMAAGRKLSQSVNFGLAASSTNCKGVVYPFLGVYGASCALLPPSLREVASGVPRKPDDGRSTPSVIAASGADSSLREGAVISLPPRVSKLPLRKGATR